MDYLKQFNSKMLLVDHSKNTVTKFGDFLTMSTYSLAQPFYKSEEMEQIYLDITKSYSQEDLCLFSEMLAIVIQALDSEPQDFLGNVFCSHDMGSTYKGQFFTPYHVSKMMAEVQLSDGDYLERDLITVSEPCSGSGGMIIAFAQALQEKGFNYQKRMYVETIDIDDLCYKMTYIQLSLLGIPAKVIKGNALSLEFKEALYTPLYFIGGFRDKLTRKFKKQKEIQIGQLSLF